MTASFAELRKPDSMTQKGNMTTDSRSHRPFARLLLGTMVLLALLVLLGSPSRAAAAVEWSSEVFQAPTNLPTDGRGVLWIAPENVGDTESSGQPTVSFELPPGVEVSSPAPLGWTCAGSPMVTCTSLYGAFVNALPGSYATGSLAPFIKLVLQTNGAVAAAHPLAITVEGAGGAPATQVHQLSISDTQLGFGITPGSFAAGAFDQAGADYTQAGGHPYEASTSFAWNTKFTEYPPEEPLAAAMAITAEGRPKDVVAELPAGFVGDPTATPKCEHLGMVVRFECPPATQVGTATANPFVGTIGRLRMFGIYNVKPPKDAPALFAFQTPAGVIPLVPTLRDDGTYGLNATVRNIPQADVVYQSSVTLWGKPADPSHDAQRCAQINFISETCQGTDEGGQAFSGFDPATYSPHPSTAPLKPFITNPTECDGQPVLTRLHVSSYEEAAAFEPDGDPDLSDPDWDSAAAEAPAVTGCEKLAFSPSIALRPTTTQASSPTGLHVELTIPQNDEPNGLATAHLKDTTVVLPEGMTVNSSSVDGLGACTSAQIGLTSPAGNGDPVFDKLVPQCPLSSKIGSVEVDTPLLEDPLLGDVYLAKQHDNPFNSLLAIYIVVEGPGLIVKLAGHVQTDPNTGRLTTSVLDNPQLPFEKFTLDFKSGPRAPLMTPPCGTHTSRANLTSWAAPSVVIPIQDSFAITQGPNGGPCPTGALDPKLSAGLMSPIAGESSPFVFNISRADGTGVFTAIDVRNPEGLTAKLKGVPYCPEAQIANAISKSKAGDGASELAVASCPSASQVGTAVAGAGAGSNPFYVTSGKVYLSGPYKGAPLSLVAVVPAVAGPFDLGVVVSRIALNIDPRTAQVSAASDPLPTALHGIPLNVREIRVALDRPGFMQSPTDCSPAAVDATVYGIGGTTAAVSSPFRLGACKALAFQPRLGLRLFGGTKRGAYPRLRATLTAREGDANFARVAVTLARSTFLAQDHIRTVCTRVQFAAETCPAASVYGKLAAFTPLLDKPLTGPVYLRSSSNPLPDLVAALRGPDDQPIKIELVGRIDSVNSSIRTTFDLVPDAAVTKVVLDMQGGQKSLLENSRDLCKSKNLATVRLKAQNGKAHDFRPPVKPQCSKAAGKRGSSKRLAPGSP